MLSGILSYINNKVLTGFMRGINSFLIIIFLNLILLNSVNFFSYISILKAQSLKEKNKSLIEALADNFIKVPEAEKDNSNEPTESDDALLYSLNYIFREFIVANNKSDISSIPIYFIPSTDVSTPPPWRNS